MWKFMLKWGLFAALIAAFCWAVYENQSAFAQILDFGFWPFLAVLVCVFLFIFFQGLILMESVSHFGIRLGVREWFGLIMVTFFTNYFVPFLGFGVRAAYLKQVHGLSLVNYSKTLIAILIVEWTVYASMALFALLVLVGQGGDLLPFLTVFMASIVAGFFVSVLIRPEWVPSFAPMASKFRKILRDWREYVHDGKTLLRLFLYTFMQFCGFAGAFLIVYGVLAPQAPWPASFVAAAMTDFAFLIRIAPAAAGSLEAGVFLASQAFGVDWAMSLVIATVIRIAIILVFLVFGPYYLWSLVLRTGLLKQSKVAERDGPRDGN